MYLLTSISNYIPDSLVCMYAEHARITGKYMCVVQVLVQMKALREIERIQVQRLRDRFGIQSED